MEVFQNCLLLNVIQKTLTNKVSNFMRSYIRRQFLMVPRTSTILKCLLQMELYSLIAPTVHTELP